MKYVPDKTGRFRERPHYLPAELDQECETVVSEFLHHLYGEVRFPVPTDALTKLIERDAQDLDLYADLSSEEGANVEGITDFIPGAKPIVRISAALSEADNRSQSIEDHAYSRVRACAIPFFYHGRTLICGYPNQRIIRLPRLAVFS